MWGYVKSANSRRSWCLVVHAMHVVSACRTHSGTSANGVGSTNEFHTRCTDISPHLRSLATTPGRVIWAAWILPSGESIRTMSSRCLIMMHLHPGAAKRRGWKKFGLPVDAVMEAPDAWSSSPATIPLCSGSSFCVSLQACCCGWAIWTMCAGGGRGYRTMSSCQDLVLNRHYCDVVVSALCVRHLRLVEAVDEWWTEVAVVSYEQ